MRRFRLLRICTESPSAECLTTTSDKNAEKNRYADVPCLESSRVVLRGHVTDYYHANYVALQNGKYFICAQAPLKFTAEDFWHMVIQEQCRFIVMLCSFMEEEKEKSSEYFPRCAEKAMIGKFLISVLKRSTRPHGITETLLNVKHRSGSAEVRHLQLTTWPDHSAPLEVDGVLDLYKEVLKYQKSNENPVLVHCSAGVGRTCTFVGGLLLMERVFQRDNPSALSVVKEIRKYRYAAVRRATQLLFMQYSVMEMFVKDGVMDEDEPQLCVYRAKFLKLVRKINSNKKKGKEMTSEMQQSNDK
ncbi:hypothetical protein Q1695_005783 [Nippostrongylus brasiliensis]|nr:hypothetical protein Q1695_005783 [Nippostrongylus brasiliensis]